jgi:hypothetical protein
MPLNNLGVSIDNRFRASFARGHTSVQTGSAGGLAKARPPKRLQRFSSLFVGRRPIPTGVDGRPTSRPKHPRPGPGAAWSYMRFVRGALLLVTSVCDDFPLQEDGVPQTIRYFKRNRIFL